MNGKNRDAQFFIASIVINILLLLTIPKLQIKQDKERKLKVGLVSIESKKVKMEKRETTNLKKVIKDTPNEKKNEEKKIEKKVDKPVSLEDLAKNISKRKVEIMTTEKSNLRNTNSELKKELLAKKDLKEAEKNIEPQHDIEIKNDVKIDNKYQTENILDKEVTVDNKNDDNIGFKSMVTKEGVEGLPSGYKLGVEDGDVVAKWDSGNMEPRYPESAQLRGMQGKVLLKMKIDKNGRIVYVFIERGSGVPEINEAIEQIARTWRIYLTKNGLNIEGNVTLEYSFKLKGTSN